MAGVKNMYLQAEASKGGILALKDIYTFHVKLSLTYREQQV